MLVFQFFGSLFLRFNFLKNNFRNPLSRAKSIVTNEVILATGARNADTNDAIVILPLATERITKFM